MKTVTYERVVEGPDTLRMYLKEISNFPQLSAEEEQDLGRRVHDGDESAFRKLIESNLRFVVAMAKKYARSGYPLHELINEGNMGLIEAASRFDAARGVRFITYASWWIRQAILAAIAHHGQVFSIPPKLKHELYRFETKVSHLTQELGHRPTVEEISKNLDMKEADVRGMMSGTPSEISLSAPVGDEHDLKLEDLIEDESITPVDEAMIASSFHEQLGICWINSMKKNGRSSIVDLVCTMQSRRLWPRSGRIFICHANASGSLKKGPSTNFAALVVRGSYSVI